MDDWRLLADAATDAGVVVLYGAAALRLSRARRDPDSLGEAGFAFFWYGLAVTGALAGLLSLLAWMGAAKLAVVGGLSFLLVVSASTAFGGLTLHLLYGLVPRRIVLAPVLALYGAFLVLQGWALIAAKPLGVAVRGWRPALLEAQPDSTAFLVACFALLYAPVIASALLHLRHAFGAPPAERRRVALVSGALVLWAAGALVIGFPSLAAHDLAQAAGRFLVLAAGGALFAASSRDAPDARAAPLPAPA